jgi:hypothetical protein
MIPKECKRLAEVDLPIAEVSRHAPREKAIRTAGAGGRRGLGRLPSRQSRLTVAIGTKSGEEVVP